MYSFFQLLTHIFNCQYFLLFLETSHTNPRIAHTKCKMLHISCKVKHISKANSWNTFAIILIPDYFVWYIENCVLCFAKRQRRPRISQHGTFVWKGIQGVWVLLPLVFISFGNCSDIGTYFILCPSIKSAPGMFMPWDQVGISLRFCRFGVWF